MLLRILSMKIMNSFFVLVKPVSTSQSVYKSILLILQRIGTMLLSLYVNVVVSIAENLLLYCVWQTSDNGSPTPLPGFYATQDSAPREPVLNKQMSALSLSLQFLIVTRTWYIYLQHIHLDVGKRPFGISRRKLEHVINMQSDCFSLKKKLCISEFIP